MKKAADMGISVNIVHPSAEPNKENERGEKIKRAQESLAYLADAAEKCGSVMAVENLPIMCRILILLMKSIGCRAREK